MRATVQQRPKTRHLLPPPVGSLSTSDAGGGELPLPAPPAMIWPPSSTGAKTKGGSGGGATAATRVNRYPMALSARRVDVGAPWTSAHLLGRKNCHRPENVRRARRLVFAAEQSASAARRIHVPPYDKVAQGYGKVVHSFTTHPHANGSSFTTHQAKRHSHGHTKPGEVHTGECLHANLLVSLKIRFSVLPAARARGRNFTATDSGFLFVWSCSCGSYFKRVSARSRGQQ